MTRKRMFPLFICLLSVFAAACSEELPPIIEPAVPIEIGFSVKTTVAQYGVINPRAFVFNFDISQFFDEVLEDEWYFWGSVEISVADRPELIRHLDIYDYRPGVMYTIPPGESQNYRVYWDGTLDNDLKLWYFLDAAPGSFHMKARGELQVYRQFNVIKPEAIEFTLTYVPTSGKIGSQKDEFPLPEWMPRIFRFPDYRKKMRDSIGKNTIGQPEK